ncbi:MAG: sugar ABC transporter ATP-binding protein [Ancalomicrobiaceae bacterium]|nr:sugar ABC transporter ATP-binding protein [Ancalomicrobiaceae bacterium]
MSTATYPLIEMTAISKVFPGVKALDDVDFRLERREVHVLFGENGAGKSTLISILAGVQRPTSGRILMDGKEISIGSVEEAANLGIGTVFQEFSLVPTLTVYENLYLGREITHGLFTDHRAMLKGARTLFAELGFDIEVTRRVVSLSRAEQQMVEIAKAFLNDLSVLILDEPTASLTEKETQKLFAFIRRAQARGVGIIYISHRIHEFSAIADRITILRDGKWVATVPVKGTPEGALVELMTGRAIDKIYPDIARNPGGKTVLEIRNLHAWGVMGVDIDVRAGEILGVAGLVGSGKSRTWRTVMGLQPATAGTVRLNGEDVTNAPTRKLLDDGVFYLPPDRKAEGLVLSATTAANLQLSLLPRPEVTSRFGFVAGRSSRSLAETIASQVEIATGHIDRVVSRLSGGNQQKVLFGKALCVERDIYIFDEPTVGVDMGTRTELYRLIKTIAETGKAVVVISSDLPEVMHLAHRLVVFSKGRIAAELQGDEISEEAVLGHFFAEVKVPA